MIFVLKTFAPAKVLLFFDIAKLFAINKSNIYIYVKNRASALPFYLLSITCVTRACVYAQYKVRAREQKDVLTKRGDSFEPHLFYFLDLSQEDAVFLSFGTIISYSLISLKTILPFTTFFLAVYRTNKT